mmetsp:Transcript_139328/g.277874  ORF Transcript_139328/g.277874 Transcript_139328/m.277874 type:complete len:495 (-) Transcript_139328:6-1490(-)
MEEVSNTRGNEAVGTPSCAMPVVIVVDPFSSGAYMTSEILQSGQYDVVRVLSRSFPQAQLDFVPPGLCLKYLATLQHDSDNPDEPSAWSRTFAALQKLDCMYVAVIAGSEPGVNLTDAIAEHFQLPGNGSKLSPCRRDKFLMIDRLHECKVDAAHQLLVNASTPVTTLHQFMEEQRLRDPTGNGWIVAKPLNSCGGDDVRLCCSIDDARRYQERVVGLHNQYGILNSAVVFQEFLVGTEYVVDTVSRAGNHKVVAVWEYDKRPMNGAPFVYFGQRLMQPVAPEFVPLCDYTCSVLDALGIRFGPCHVEVKLTAAGPRLVEVGARLHGVRASWVPLANEAIGYDQISAGLSAYGLASGTDFDELPDRYKELKTHVFQVFLVSSCHGQLRSLPRLDEVRQLRSWHSDAIVSPGALMKPTVDGWSSPGIVSLLHADPTVLLADYTKVLHASGFRGNPKWEPPETRGQEEPNPVTQNLNGELEFYNDGLGVLFDVDVL